MLLSFRVENYLSIRDEQEMLLTRSRKIAAKVVEIPQSRYTVSPVAALYGGNASGKTNILRAIRFMGSAVKDSHSVWKAEGSIPRSAFGFDNVSAVKPTRLEAEILLGDVRYQYGFECDDRRFLKEWLYVYPGTRRQVWFERDADGDEEWYFGKHLGGRNRLIEEVTRSNSLFLSTAAALDHPRIEELYRWFSTSLVMAEPSNREARLRHTAWQVAEDSKFHDYLKMLLTHADIGIRDIRIQRHEFDDNVISEAKKIVEAVRPDADLEILSTNHFKQALIKYSTSIGLGHSHGEGDTVFLPFEAESLGTVSLIALVGPVLDALRDGTCLLVDELETSLHPSLVAEIVRLFQSPVHNRQGAQLIFSSHNTSLLAGVSSGSPVLGRDQIWLVEKQPSGATQLRPLTDFSPRKLENLERGYLQGRYGAVPSLDSQALADLFSSHSVS